MGKESAGAVISSDPCSCPCCTWICFQETPPLPWGHQDLLILPGGGTAEKRELQKERGYLEWMGPVPSHPGEKGERLDETWCRGPELRSGLSWKPQELAVHRTSAQSHPTGTQPSLSSTFLCSSSLPPVTPIQPSFTIYLAHRFLPNVSSFKCPTALPTPHPCALHPSQWPAHLLRLQLLLLSLHRIGHNMALFLVATAAANTIKSNDSICITCCHCPEMFPYSVGRLSHRIA